MKEQPGKELKTSSNHVSTNAELTDSKFAYSGPCTDMQHDLSNIFIKSYIW